MSTGHGPSLYLPGRSALHRLPPQVKIVGTAVAVLAVVATPAEVFWAFAAHVLVLATVWRIGGIPVRWVAGRAVIEAPFVVLALLLPFGGGEPRVSLLGLSLSVAGLYAGWNIVVKGTLGVLVSLTLAATTPLPDLVLGLQRLRVPSVVITVLTLMLRYLDVIVGEAGRMRLARLSRGADERVLHQVGAVARSVGSLFIRSYERGERVYLAMLSRGWNGSLPTAGHGATGGEWLGSLVAPAVMVAVTSLAWWSR